MVDQAVSGEAIAIVGMGCRFPGSINGPSDLWRVVRDGIDVVGEIPPERFDADELFDDRPATPGRIMSRRGGYLQNVEDFDAYFFGIAPVEAERLDPQQRLLLELGWESFADAGLPADHLAGSDTGVFVGMWINDFENRLFDDPDGLDFHMTTGSGRYAGSGRLSYFMGLQGPSITIDTACSSSLVAVHLACQSLRQGECRQALAGGSNVILEPDITIAYSQSRMMAPDGHCKFGDHRGDGYVRSDGAATVVLKRLSDAVEDGDRVYAVIRGSAVNNDGRSGGLMATPSRDGQADMLRKAYRAAGIDPGLVNYIEAHGTGTRAGDPVEIGAIGDVCSVDRPTDRPLYLGSVKTNLGHTEGAAGVAGLIKAALAIHHRQIPGNLHLEKRNPEIDWAGRNLELPTELTPWPNLDEAVAGVSAFGITGTNAHVVLSETTAVERETTDAKPPYVLPLSAQSPEALAATAKAYRDFLTAPDSPPIADIVYTAARRQAHLDHRLVASGTDAAGLATRLAAFEVGEPTVGVVSGQVRYLDRRRVAFVFPGQGSQWVGMGRELVEAEPVFMATIAACEAAMKPFVDWSLVEQLRAEPGDEAYLLDRIDVIQPTLLAMEIALADLWRSWGVEPDAVVGHSMGEVGAAYVAGAIDLASAMEIICRRSSLMGTRSGEGGMAVVELTADDAGERLQGREDLLSVAVLNSPQSSVVAGDEKALAELMVELEADGVFCRAVEVDVASHSPHMDSIRPQLVEQLADLRPSTGQTPIYSTCRPGVLYGEELGPEYWGDNLRKPVQFGRAIELLIEDETTTFIEMSPHPILLHAIRQCLGGGDQLTVGSLRRGEPEQATMLDALGSVHVDGGSVDWSTRVGDGRVVSLPSYQWQRERLWYEPPTQRRRSTLRHPIWHDVHTSAQGTSIWDGVIDLDRLPFLDDHRVDDAAILPAAGFVELALTAAAGMFPRSTPSLVDVELHEALPFGTDRVREVQLAAVPDVPGRVAVELFSREPEAGEWTRHLSGRIVIEDTAAPGQAATRPSEDGQPGSLLYAEAGDRRLNYGPAFQGVERYWRDGDEVHGDLNSPAADDDELYAVPYSVLDAAFQLILPALPDDGRTYLPVSIGCIRHFDRYRSDARLRAAVTTAADGAAVVGDVQLLADDVVVTEVSGLRMEPLRSSGMTVGDLFYEVEWQAAEQVPVGGAPAMGAWVILGDAGGLGQAVADELRTQGSEVAVVAFDERHSLGSAVEAAQSGAKQFRGVIDLWSLDTADVADTPASEATTAQTAGLWFVVELLQQLHAADEPPRLWLVTGDAAPVESDGRGFAGAQRWGLGRVIDNERPDLRCKRIDLASQTSTAEHLIRELSVDDDEREVAVRTSGRYVSRLTPRRPEGEPGRPTDPAPGRPYRIAIGEPGILDNLHRVAKTRTAPSAGEVEIEVRVTGLNFLNVLSALGVYPGYADGVGPLGIEGAGVVTAVGEGVTDFAIGDAVMGMAHGSLGSHTTVHASLITGIPANLSFAEAATIPCAFMTASYALNRLGRMQAGERVLIHSATGGVGLAAVQLAKAAGAEIFATAGTEEKREYLRDLGISAVMDSRSLDFADQIMEFTDGAGVDIVLNSLAGEAIAKGIECLGPYGRFIEIGARDIYDDRRIGLSPFQANLSYFAVNLNRMAMERPELLGETLREVGGLLADGRIEPLPVQEFPVADVSDAFRLMAQAKHRGKVVITQDTTNTTRSTTTGTVEAGQVRADGAAGMATYVITGGTGALGLLTARWLAEREPCRLALLARGEPNDGAHAAIADIEALGSAVTVHQVDVTDRDSLVTLFDDIDGSGFPLRGVVHAAGVLQDSTLMAATAEDFQQALAPKVRGAWNLHQLTMDRELEAFVLFSSVTALLGNPGQANYAAGNAYLDALAHHRRATGLPAVSINWGPWADVGLAAADAIRGERLRQQGLRPLSPTVGIAALARAWEWDSGQVAVMRFNLERWSKTNVNAKDAPLFAGLEQVAASAEPVESPTLTLLAEAKNEQARQQLITDHVRTTVADVLRMPTDKVHLGRPLTAMGMDSLMALELSNRLEADLQLALSATLIWNYPTVEAVAGAISERLGPPATAEDPLVGTAEDATTGSATGATDDATTGVEADSLTGIESEDLDGLSRSELEALLADELSAIDDLVEGP